MNATAAANGSIEISLYRVDAAWLAVSPAADEPWLWAILAQVPDPTRWTRLSRRRVAAMLRAHRIRRVTADQILDALHQPRLMGAPGVTAAVRTRIAALVPQLQVVADQRRTAEQHIDQLLDLPDRRRGARARAS